MNYSPNPAINETIKALLAIGCPPIPVAPKQDARKEGCHHVEKIVHKYRPDKPETVFCDGERAVVKGDYCKISFTACDGEKAPVKGAFVRIDEHQNPTSLFTGKNPSYLDSFGRPQKLLHGNFQNRLPTDEELKKFFCHFKTGIGTLGGHSGVDWIDFDVKCYESQEDCDADVERIFSNCPELRNSWIERTGSNGYRIAVRPKQKPTFTNFATSPDGKHVGEALYQGRFTVLSPTTHPNGKKYRRVSFGEPVEVESLELIGIYPSKEEVEQAERTTKREKRKAEDPNYDKPTDPTGNPWDIRNFAHYLDGYSEQGVWGYARCPHHPGATSLTSFRVHLHTGATKHWCNCNPKDVYKAALELAKSRGYKIDKNAKKQQERENFNKTNEYQYWKKSRQLTATEQTHTQFISIPVPPENSILGVKSGLGTGKTTGHGKVVAALDDEGWIGLGYINSLLFQTCGKWGFYHLQRDLPTEQDRILLRDPQGKAAMCVDSLIHLEPDSADGKNLVIDEANNVIRHLLEGRTSIKRYRQKCLERFEEVVRRAKRIFLYDGLLNDITVNYIQEIRGYDTPITIIENTYKDNHYQCDFLEGTITEDGINERDRSPLIQAILNATKPISVCSDSQNELETLDRQLTAKGKKVLRLDSTTKDESWAHDFYENPDAKIQEVKPDAVLLSPCGESGLSIDTKDYFSDVYGLFFGVISPDQITQFLSRFRDNKAVRHILVPPSGLETEEITDSCIPEAIEQAITEYVLSSGLAAIQGLDTEKPLSNLIQEIVRISQDVHFKTLCKIKAKQNFERKNLRQCEKEILIESGHTVNEVILEPLELKEHKQAKKEINIEKAENVFYSADVTIEKALEIDGTFGASKQEQWSAEKAKIKDRLPNIEKAYRFNPTFLTKVLIYNPILWLCLDKKVFNSEFIYTIKFGDRRLMSKCYLYWLLQHFDIAVQKSRHQWQRRLEGDTISLVDVKDLLPKLNALKAVGIEKFLTPGFEWHKESPELQTVLATAKKYRCLPDPKKCSPVQYVGLLLDLLGIKTRERQAKDGGRFYRVAPISEVQQAILASIEYRERDWLDGTKEPADFEPILKAKAPTESSFEGVTHPTKNVYINSGGVLTTEQAKNEGCVEGKTLDVQSFEGVTHPAENIYKYSEGVLTLTSEQASILQPIANALREPVQSVADADLKYIGESYLPMVLEENSIEELISIAVSFTSDQLKQIASAIPSNTKNKMLALLAA